jgi:hypothetical protein
MMAETCCSEAGITINCANSMNYCVSVVSGVTLLCIQSVMLHVAGAGRCERTVQEQEGQGVAEGDCKEV